MPSSKAKKPKRLLTGRPKSAAPKKHRHMVNYNDAENAAIAAAAKAEGDPYLGRWIGKAALAHAERVLKGGK